MNPPDTQSPQGSVRLRLILGIIVMALLPMLLWADTNGPAWWQARGVTNGNSANDYAAANQGQLKNLATAAVAELDAQLPSPGAGDELHTLINKWSTLQSDGTRLVISGSTTNDYAAVNLGQLKTLVKPLYDRLLWIGYHGYPLESGTYPWAGKESSANDYAMANIGQVKNLFSFDLTLTGTNGLPNWWQNYYFGSTVSDPNALAPSGVLINGSPATILQAYSAGLNPVDYYNGNLPTLSIVNGENQCGIAGMVSAMPLCVKVNAGDINAPIIFSVDSGRAQLLPASKDGTPSVSLQARTNSLYVDADGVSQNVALAYIVFPDFPGDRSSIKIAATSGTKVISVSATATTNDSSASPVSNFTANSTSENTVELSWISSDPSLPTTIQGSDDGGITWYTIGVVAPGQNQVIVTNMTPDNSVAFRAIAGNWTSSSTYSSVLSIQSRTNINYFPSAGTSATSGSTTKPLSRPILLGDQNYFERHFNAFWGYYSEIGEEYKYYLTEIKHILYTCNDSEDLEFHFSSGEITITRKADPKNGRVDTSSVDSGGIYPSSLDIPNDTEEIISDTNRHWEKYNCPAELEGYAYVQSTLSDEYTFEQFQADFETWIPDFSGVFEENINAAFKQSNLNEGCAIAKLRYKFKVNKDPNGIVEWDVQFTPDDGGEVKHEIHSWQTNGATESPVFTIDPTQLNNKQNGVYNVVLLPFEIKIQAGTTYTPTTISDSNRNVIVGEQITLVASVPSPCPQPTACQWTLPADAISYYDAANGQITMHDPADFSKSSITFYLTKPCEGRKITCNLTINGIAQTVSAALNVKKPNITIAAGFTSSPQCNTSGTLGSITLGSTLYSGFSYNYTNPRLPSGFTGGSYAWVQIVNSAKINGVGWSKSTSGLDTKWPYSYIWQDSDSPGTTGILPANSPLSRDDSFSLYLMYVPSFANSIYVPLQKVDWWWGETATYHPGMQGFNGTWVGSGAYSGKSGPTDCTDEPTWNHIATAQELAR